MDGEFFCFCSDPNLDSRCLTCCPTWMDTYNFQLDSTSLHPLTATTVEPNYSFGANFSLISQDVPNSNIPPIPTFLQTPTPISTVVNNLGSQDERIPQISVLSSLEVQNDPSVVLTDLSRSYFEQRNIILLSEEEQNWLFVTGSSNLLPKGSLWMHWNRQDLFGDTNFLKKDPQESLQLKIFPFHEKILGMKRDFLWKTLTGEESNKLQFSRKMTPFRGKKKPIIFITIFFFQHLSSQALSYKFTPPFYGSLLSKIFFQPSTVYIKKTKETIMEEELQEICDNKSLGKESKRTINDLTLSCKRSIERSTECSLAKKFRVFIEESGDVDLFVRSCAKFSEEWKDAACKVVNGFYYDKYSMHLRLVFYKVRFNQTSVQYRVFTQLFDPELGEEWIKQYRVDILTNFIFSRVAKLISLERV